MATQISVYRIRWGVEAAQWLGSERKELVRFINRSHAGRRLARRLDHLRTGPTVVLGLPRGGVPVGFEVARRVSAPLEVLLVRKIGAPFQPELAIGALGEGGIRIVDQDRINQLGITARQVERIEMREKEEMARQAELFRQGRPAADLEGKTAVIVDDGIATGSTALAACSITRQLGAARIVLATPVAPRQAYGIFESAADEFVAVATPRRLGAIGFYYTDFRPTPDREVIELLEKARRG